MTGRSSVLLKTLVTTCLMTASACSATTDRAATVAEFDGDTGRLHRVEFDATHDGRNDAISHMDGTVVRRIEVDLDENGRTDRWDFYGPDRRLDSVGFSRLNNGVMDARAYYSPDAKIDRINISTEQDGRFNRVEFYEAGVLVRSEEDTNGDGRPDKWETYEPNPDARPDEPPVAIRSVAFEDVGNGSLQRRVIFESGGRVRMETYPGDVPDGQTHVARR